ncbi:MAG: hypothetical protein IIB56_12335 [Planctomycetes bacterium]|nr:hypothetical protein [Planctomycetota bacterium]
MGKEAKKKVVRAKTPSKELRCFIIMPFTKAEFKDSSGTDIILTKGKLKHIYEKLISKAVKEYSRKKVKFVSVHRYEKTRGNFVKGIVNDLDKADLVIADLTGLNPNVFYELGIRHTLKVGTVMLTQDIASLPADLKSYVAFEYKYPEESVAFDEYYPLFKKKLHKAVDEYLEDYEKGEYDNPVRDFIGSRNIFQDEQRIKEVKGNIKLMDIIQNEYLTNVIGLSSKIESWASGKSDLLYLLQNSVKPFLNRLMMLNEQVAIIIFIKELGRSLDINQRNMQFVKDAVIQAKDTKVALEESFGFVDMDNKEHHVLSLCEYYKDVSKPRECPIFKSFRKFISDWERELESLTS